MFHLQTVRLTRRGGISLDAEEVPFVRVENKSFSIHANESAGFTNNSYVVAFVTSANSGEIEGNCLSERSKHLMFCFRIRKLAARSKARTAFARSNTEIVGSNPTGGMDVCVCFACVYSVSTPCGGG
jgi:hypothetical protein